MLSEAFKPTKLAFSGYANRRYLVIRDTTSDFMVNTKIFGVCQTCSEPNETGASFCSDACQKRFYES